MPITGSATLEGTAHYRDRFRGKAAENHFRNEQNLWLSSVGIGTYLGNADDATDADYAESIVRAVELGANVIDTSSNYRFQRSERSVGKALNGLTAHRGFERSEIVICTKSGYLPFDGSPPRDMRAYIADTFVRPGIARFEDFVDGSHCMTPAFLENQLQQSLRNMDLNSIDVYYIHNPESQLGFVPPNEFYSRIQSAFAFLEQVRTEGTIKAYGLATWNAFRVPPDSPQYHSLSRLVESAKEVGGESHGFRFIQLPFNLGMPEALTLLNHTIEGADEPVSTIEAAAALGVTVVSSASILQGRVARGLPETIREPLGSLATDAQTAIQFVRSTPGITTALVGMSSREHVEENLQLMRVEPLHPDDFRRAFFEE
ncbi:MAG TPA: aldo/keto reductase [Pyrinomonadaceae bacterium]|nr:aldo/keto reductase [Pyrinomonadaceae bacterium]